MWERSYQGSKAFFFLNLSILFHILGLRSYIAKLQLNSYPEACVVLCLTLLGSNAFRIKNVWRIDLNLIGFMNFATRVCVWLTLVIIIWVKHHLNVSHNVWILCLHFGKVQFLLKKQKKSEWCAGERSWQHQQCFLLQRTSAGTHLGQVVLVLSRDKWSRYFSTCEWTKNSIWCIFSGQRCYWADLYMVRLLGLSEPILKWKYLKSFHFCNQ